ncbi:MAG: ribonuclease H-like domain-containing protein [Patescibacteria group bacterium]
MIILDIETYKTDNQSYLNYKSVNISAPSNYKDQSKIDAYIENEKKKVNEKAALSPLTGKIILIGILTDATENHGTSIATEVGIVDYSVAQDTNEKFLLQQFWEMLSDLWDNGHQPLVTYNGKQFDLPYIISRSTIMGLTKPNLLPSMKQLLSKYDSRDHIDLFQTLNPNYGDYSSLNEWSYLTGDSNVLEHNNASEIANWYETGQMDKIIEKNKMDLFKTYFLYNKVRSWI